MTYDYDLLVLGSFADIRILAAADALTVLTEKRA